MLVRPMKGIGGLQASLTGRIRLVSRQDVNVLIIGYVLIIVKQGGQGSIKQHCGFSIL